MTKKEEESKKISVAAIAIELEEESYLKSKPNKKGELKPEFSARTYQRNFKALLDSLNVEKGRFKNKRNQYMVNKGQVPMFKAMLRESTIKGSYFHYAMKKREKEASIEEIITTYHRMKGILTRGLDEPILKHFLKLIDKAVGYSFAVEQQRIQKELADFMSTIESFEYRKKVRELKKFRKHFFELTEESKKSIEEELAQEEKTESPKNQ